jgi:hypothetical protein
VFINKLEKSSTLPTARSRIMRRWLVFAFIALLALFAVPRCAAEDGLEIPNFKTMKIKELKAILADRGKECKGCAEKADFVAMAADVWSLPVIEKPAETEKPATPDLSDVDDERIKRMMDEMQNGPRATGDPERDALMKKLHASGIKFAGGDGMPLDQLRNLEKAMGGIKMKKQGDEL